MLVTQGNPNLWHRAAFGLIELVVVVAVIGVVSAIAFPFFSDVRDNVEHEKDRRNAQQIVNLSTALNAIGIAHVIPDSLGGVEATAKLLREGITISSGPSAGERIALSGLTDREIANSARFIDIVYLDDQITIRFLPEGVVP